MRAVVITIAFQLLVNTSAFSQPTSGTDLDPPRSLEHSEMADSAVFLSISQDALFVNDVAIIDLEDGSVPIQQRVSEFSPIIPELQSVIEDVLDTESSWADARRELADASCVLVVDRHTSYETLTYVMMSASAAGVRDFSVVAAATDWSSLWSLPTDAPLEPTLLPLYSPTIADGSEGPELHTIFGVGDRPPVEATSTQEPVEPPRMLVAITAEGFILTDLRQSGQWEESGFGRPIAGCPMFGETEHEILPTICIPDSRAEQDDPVEQSDFRGLYNRLVQIRQAPPWAGQYTADNMVINIVADRSVEVDVVVRVMTVARQYLADDTYADDAAFGAAQLRMEEGAVVPLFPTPVLLLPRASSD